MNINIYYGGRGLVDDPTILVINKIQEVLDELNVNVNRYNLYEMKNTITTLSQTVTEADGIILATTVEWVGMGGYMQTFLDSCWLYSDKSQILDKYMFPVVMARTYGEREVTLALNNSWEIIGGKIGPALSAYIDDTTDFEFNDNYKIIIEKYAENVYRTISQRIMQLPSSSQTIKNNMLKDTIKLTPQESEQLSKYASDDAFVKTQKQDIESLASIYKELLNDQENGGDDYYLNVFRDNFNPTTGYKSTYMISISDKDKLISIYVDGRDIKVTFGENKSADVIGKLSKETLDDTLSLLKHDDLQKAVALLQKAKIIHLSAISYSLLLGQTFQLNMNRLGKMVHICPINGEELFMDNLIHEDDCLLMVSYSGQIDSMIHLARLAKRKGVSIIVITSLGDNDLRKYGDVVLNISTREKLYSKIGGLVNENSIKLILDILYACYFELNYDDNLNKRINISKESETTRFSSLDIMKESES